MLNISNKRGLILLTGKDTRCFLQNLITNNIDNLDQSCIVYTLILDVKGRMQYDIFISLVDDCFLIEYEKKFEIEFFDLLKKYCLSYNVDIIKIDLKVYFLFYNEECDFHDEDLVFNDPRLNNLGCRIYSSRMIKCNRTYEDYLDLRLKNLLPEGRKEIEGYHVFDCSFERYVEENKGCYVGQEVVSRIRKMKNGVSKYDIKVMKVLDNCVDNTITNLYMKEQKVGKVMFFRKNYAFVFIDRFLCKDKDTILFDNCTLALD
ncbi:hypothetical protein GUI12_03365 [Anaplasmataceae bacterium AB001_6]|nr:hypothetical protein GUI12_03365 [Anaplasmataceae bacterium AB001_6]